MCTHCDSINLKKRFYNPSAYENTLKEIQELINTGDFILIDATCAIEDVRNKEGEWLSDIICHTIACKQCGQRFVCSIDTYHGQGSFRLE
ncbi:hypothetical protein [Amedibacillus sp. YH-ame10]